MKRPLTILALLAIAAIATLSALTLRRRSPISLTRRSPEVAPKDVVGAKIDLTEPSLRVIVSRQDALPSPIVVSVMIDGKRFQELADQSGEALFCGLRLGAATVTARSAEGTATCSVNVQLNDGENRVTIKLGVDADLILYVHDKDSNPIRATCIIYNLSDGHGLPDQSQEKVMATGDEAGNIRVRHLQVASLKNPYFRGQFKCVGHRAIVGAPGFEARTLELPLDPGLNSFDVELTARTPPKGTVVRLEASTGEPLVGAQAMVIQCADGQSRISFVPSKSNSSGEIVVGVPREWRGYGPDANPRSWLVLRVEHPSIEPQEFDLSPLLASTAKDPIPSIRSTSSVERQLILRLGDQPLRHRKVLLSRSYDWPSEYRMIGTTDSLGGVRAVISPGSRYRIIASGGDRDDGGGEREETLEIEFLASELSDAQELELMGSK